MSNTPQLRSPAWYHLASAQRRLLGKLGFLDVPCPWHASEDAISITLPDDQTPTRASTNGDPILLVGSAEQALLDLAMQGKLPEGQPLCTITPCFRLGDHGSPFHHPYFLKLELGIFWTKNPPPMDQLLARATFLQDTARILHLVELGHEPTFGPQQPEGVRHFGDLEEVPLPDLQYGNIEIGSYGARRWKNFGEEPGISWAYGTGMAMPRALEALEALKNPSQGSPPAA